jgi:hypothetical protein
MEWNARSQLTTWKPTPKMGPLGQPDDYAKKQWSGLISGYYAPRVRLYMQHSLAAIAEHRSAAKSATPVVTPTTRSDSHPDPASLKPALVTLAYEFQTAFGNEYPVEPVGDPAVVSAALISKWGRFFSACAGVPADTI